MMHSARAEALVLFPTLPPPPPHQVVTSSASQMSPQQLERFTREYAALAQQAEQAGVSVDKTLKQVRLGRGRTY